MDTTPTTGSTASPVDDFVKFGFLSEEVEQHRRARAWWSDLADYVHVSIEHSGLKGAERERALRVRSAAMYGTHTINSTEVAADQITAVIVGALRRDRDTPDGVEHDDKKGAELVVEFARRVDGIALSPAGRRAVVDLVDTFAGLANAGATR